MYDGLITLEELCSRVGFGDDDFAEIIAKFNEGRLTLFGWYSKDLPMPLQPTALPCPLIGARLARIGDKGLIITIGTDVYENDAGEVSLCPIYFHDVTVRRAEADAIWPDVPASTGLPGRPNENADIIRKEHERRWIAGQCANGRRAEAKALVTWFNKAYQSRDCPALQTAINLIPAGRFGVPKK